MNSYSISPIELAFNTGEFAQVLNLIESYKKSNNDIQLVTMLELTYFECRTFERIGKWEQAWNLYQEAEISNRIYIKKDIKVTLLLLVTKLYLLWRTTKLKDGIDEHEKYEHFIHNVELNYQKYSNENSFNFENWLGLYFIIMFNFYVNTGELEQAWKMNSKSLSYYSKINYELYISKIYANFGEIHLMRGEIDESLAQYKKAVELSQKNNDPITTIESLLNLGQIYYLLDEIDKAFDYYKESLTIAQSIKNYLYIVKINYKMMVIYYNLAKITEVELILNKLEELDNLSNQNILINEYVKIGTALHHLLSGSLKDTVLAQKILIEIYNKPVIDFESYFFVMILLTEISLLEYQIYTSNTILNELNSLLSNMFNLASKNNATRLIIETRLLQAKIEIISGNLERGEKLFIQAQFNAKEKKLNLLENKIYNKYEQFKQQLKKWKILIANNASITERLEFAEIHSYIKELRTKVLK